MPTSESQATVHAELKAAGVEEHPFFVGDGYTKLFKIPAEHVIGQHAHSIGHHSVLLIGKAIVHSQGQQAHLQAPATVYLPAHVEHQVEAVTPILWACNWPNADLLTDADQLELSVIG